MALVSVMCCVTPPAPPETTLPARLRGLSGAERAQVILDILNAHGRTGRCTAPRATFEGADADGSTMWVLMQRPRTKTTTWTLDCGGDVMHWVEIADDESLDLLLSLPCYRNWWGSRECTLFHPPHR